MRNTHLGVTLEFLKEKAVIVEDGMQTHFPQFGTTETLQISKLTLEPKTYAYNNGTIAFVDENKTFRVIPNFKDTQKVLIQNGYRKDHFYVPFSNWDYPIAHKEYWESLKELQRFQNAE